MTKAVGTNATLHPPAAEPRSVLAHALRLINEARRVHAQREEERRGLLGEAIQMLMEAKRRGRARSTKRSLPSTGKITPLEAALEELLDHPSQRLAVYGTLAPGRENHQVIARIQGTWRQGWIRGELGRIGPYPAFRWRPRGERIPVQVLSAPSLPAHWARLDRFEGAAYRRILAPVMIAGGTVQAAHLYEGVKFA